MVLDPQEMEKLLQGNGNGILNAWLYKMVKSNKAVFLDRDGTINEEVGYIDRADKLKLISGSAEAIRRLNERGIKVIIVTNQSGVARGIFTEAFLNEINHKLIRELSKAGAFVDAIYYCPHHPTEGNGIYRMECECRKPKIGLLIQASCDFDIDLRKSYVVGDSIVDIIMAKNAGLKGVLVLTGHGRSYLNMLGNGKDQVQPACIAKDLAHAVEWIIKDSEGG